MHLASFFSLLSKEMEKKISSFYFQIFSLFMSCFKENTGEIRQRANSFHLGGMHLQPLDNNGLENTPKATAEMSPFWKWSRPEASFTAATPSVPPLKESKQAAWAITWHISIQFPLQNVFIFRLMACHFAGAFGQELILESKQIFRGAIFHQVLIFLHSRSLYSLI